MTFLWPWMFLLLPLPWLLRKWLPPAHPDVALRLPYKLAPMQARAGAAAAR